MDLLSFTKCKNKNMNHISINIELNYVGTNHKCNELQPSVFCKVASVRLSNALKLLPEYLHYVRPNSWVCGREMHYTG